MYGRLNEEYCKHVIATFEWLDRQAERLNEMERFQKELRKKEENGRSDLHRLKRTIQSC